MTSTLQHMCKELEKCTESLEEDVRSSLHQLNDSETFNESAVALESSKDYHFKEILNQLRQIKDHINVIANHNQCIQSLQHKINGVKIDKNYIKKQVESFQRLGLVNRREHKPIRPPETSSMKLLECWEQMLEDQEEKKQLVETPPVRKRPTNLRKTKKVISSTIETFLESPNVENALFELLTEEHTDVEKAEAINEEVLQKVPDDDIHNIRDLESLNEEETEEDPDTKPRIVYVEETEEDPDTKPRIVDVEETEEDPDTKPRIVDVIYKKNGNVPC